MSVILKLNSPGGWFAGVISAKTQFFDQVKISSTSKLISRISKLLQKLLKCFSGITISVSFLPTLFASYSSSLAATLKVFPVYLFLKDSESEERGSLG